MRAMSALRLAPLAAASVAAVCLRSWNRKPVMPTSAVAGSHTRRRKLLRRIGWPSALGNTRPSAPGSAYRSMWTASDRATKDGMPTVRLPAAVFGGLKVSVPFTSPSLRATVTRLRSRSTSHRRRPASSPQRRPL
ncbi:MAG: hypothetical protein M3P70_17780 [Actinomycetota bacterium]|nr:hypothetical protein [Actinomycetota bacterium]